MPLTRCGARRLRVQLREVTVERCSDTGIAACGGSVELTGCGLRKNKKDTGWDAGTITADGRRVG